jgi:hypothetical protein
MKILKVRQHQRFSDVPLGRVILYRGEQYRKVRPRATLQGETINAVCLDSRIRPRCRYIWPDNTVTRT